MKEINKLKEKIFKLSEENNDKFKAFRKKYKSKRYSRLTKRKTKVEWFRHITATIVKRKNIKDIPIIFELFHLLKHKFYCDGYKNCIKDMEKKKGGDYNA